MVGVTVGEHEQVDAPDRMGAQGAGQRSRARIDEHGGAAGRLEQRRRAFADVEKRERGLARRGRRQGREQ